MTKLHSILEKDHLTPVDDVSLKALSQKCNKLEALQTEINQQEQNIKALKEKQRKLSEEEIPSFLQEKGLTSIRLNNGTEVSVSEVILPGVLVDNRPFCYQWLRDNGFGDLIKNTVSVNFGMGEDEDAINLKKQINVALVCPAHCLKKFNLFFGVFLSVYVAIASKLKKK